jgi:hypothetical protein
LELFCLVLTTIAAITLMISSFSLIKGNNLFPSRILVVTSILNQYFVSLASFKEIYNLLTKSALLCADCDSSTLAPIDVPDRISCLYKTLPTPGFSSRVLHKLTILTAKLNVLSVICYC